MLPFFYAKNHQYQSHTFQMLMFEFLIQDLSLGIVTRATRRVSLVEQELFILPEDLRSPFSMGFLLLDFYFSLLCLQIVVCPFVLFRFAITSSALLRFTYLFNLHIISSGCIARQKCSHHLLYQQAFISRVKGYLNSTSECCLVKPISCILLLFSLMFCHHVFCPSSIYLFIQSSCFVHIISSGCIAR